MVDYRASSSPQPTPFPLNDHANYHYFALQLHPPPEVADVGGGSLHHPLSRRALHSRAEGVAADLGLQFVGRVGELSDYYQVAMPKRKKRREYDEDEDGVGAELEDGLEVDEENDDLSIVEGLIKAREGVSWVERQVPRQRLFRRGNVDMVAVLEDRSATIVDVDGLAAKVGIHDPLFAEQWHLHNRDPTEKGNDINVAGVWAQEIFGENVTVCFVDDGMDFTHPDLKDNFFEGGSYDFNDHVALPMPRLPEDRHGTRCAGEVAAKHGNDVCGVGIAFKSRISAVRILSGPLTESDEAAAIFYKMQENHIYSCSWGPQDDGRSMDAPPKIVKDAVMLGINEGRGGLGAVYVFAAGNGGAHSDNCNFDGYTNSIYTITVASIDRKHNHPPYSEECSANIVSMYSSGSGFSITTTDWPAPCTNGHGGTSAAAPIVSGILALVLSIRPDLSWRDIQHLTVSTAIPINPDDDSWAEVAKGRRFSHKFGFGKMDATAIVDAARKHVKVNPQASFDSDVVIVDKPILQGEHDELIVPVTVTQANLDSVGFKRLEHLTVTVAIEHQKRGDVNVKLRSPNGVESFLGVKRPYDGDTNGFRNWTFMSVKHWDEDPLGEWKLIVWDHDNPTKTGKFVSFWITFYGESAYPPFVRPTTPFVAPTPTPNATAIVLPIPSPNITSPVPGVEPSPPPGVEPSPPPGVEPSPTPGVELPPPGVEPSPNPVPAPPSPPVEAPANPSSSHGDGLEDVTTPDSSKVAEPEPPGQDDQNTGAGGLPVLFLVALGLAVAVLLGLFAVRSIWGGGGAAAMWWGRWGKGYQHVVKQDSE
ncbi:pheromone processing endoprotease, partial [Irineochytrium annulatum]